MKQLKRQALFVGAVMALFAVMAMNVAAQDDKMMDKKKMDGQMMMKENPKPIVAIIRAEWCSACQKLEPTFKELTEQYKDRLNFVVLDVSTDDKVAESAKKAEELGISKFFEANKKKTSTVVVFGEQNKVSFKTDHNYDRAAYVKAFDDVLKMDGMMMKKS